jgi:hypothetical protein
VKFLLLLPLFLAAVSPAQAVNDGSPVAVLEFRWYRDRKTPTAGETAGMVPARAVIAENKKFQREARAQLPPGAIDPNTLTIDGRSEALEKISQESRTRPPAAVEGFSYHATVRNQANTPIDVLYLEFEFTERANPANRVRRHFLCSARMKAKEKMDLRAFSSLGPSDVISVESLSADPTNLFESAVYINRIEYSNGAIIQREDWNFAALKPAADRVASQPWGSETCRSL